MLDRRSFLAAAATAAAGPALADDPPAVIDTHVHLWDLKRLKLPWVEPNTPLGKDYLVADYNAAARGLNVVKAVYLEVDVAPDQKAREVDVVLEYIQRADTPLSAAVVGGKVDDADFAKYLDGFKNKAAVKGVRTVLHGGGTPKGHCLTREFQRGLTALAERGLHFELCMRPAELPDAAECVKRNPDLNFVLDHCGNPNPAGDLTAWKRDLAEVAKRPNVVCKVSGFLANAPEGKWQPGPVAAVINHVLDSFGPDRILFGGDWPVCLKAATLGRWLETVRTSVRDRPGDWERKLLHDNAVRVYRLW